MHTRYRLFAWLTFAQAAFVIVAPTQAAAAHSKIFTPPEAQTRLTQLDDTVEWHEESGTFTRSFRSADLEPLFLALHDDFLRPYAEALLLERLEHWPLSRTDLGQMQRRFDAMGEKAAGLDFGVELSCLLALRQAEHPQDQLAAVQRYLEGAPEGRDQVQFTIMHLVRVGTAEAEAMLRSQQAQLQPHLDEDITRYEFGLRSLAVLRTLQSLPDAHARLQYLIGLLRKEKPLPRGWGRHEFLLFLAEQIERLQTPSAITFLTQELRTAKARGELTEYELDLQTFLLRKQHLEAPVFVSVE